MEALDYLHRRGRYAEASVRRPALVLLDLHLSSLTAVEFLRTVRGDETLCATSITVFTESGRHSDVRRSYEAGANCYLVKPRNRKELDRRLAQFLRFWLEVVRLPGRWR